MIISHRHKFIFLKSSKTAGTSTEIALSKFCGPDDIITPIEAKDEEMRRELGYPGPQNYLLPRSGYSIYEGVKYLITTRKRKKENFHQHMSAKDAKACIGDEVWNSYYKFCIARNPWDRFISYYYWRNKSEPRPTISKFVSSNALLRLKKKGFGLYTIDGKLAVDKVCKFENLSSELEEIRKHVGIPEKLELPRSKGKHRKDKRDYRDVLGEDDRAKIAEVFRDEISLLGYEW